MVRLPAPFNARLHDIKEAFERDDLAPLAAYLRDTPDPEVQQWMADRVDPSLTDGHKLVAKGPSHRPRGGKAFDRMMAVAEALHRLMNNPADQRTEEVKVLQVSDPYPNYPWTMQSNLDPALKAKIRAAFIDIKDTAILKPLKAEGFAPATDRDYDVIRDLGTILNLDLSKF